MRGLLTIIQFNEANLAMNIVKTNNSPNNRAENGSRITVLEVVSESDASADLTAALEIHDGLGAAFDTHTFRYGWNSLPVGGRDGAHCVPGDGPALDGALESVFKQVRPDVVHTHRLADLGIVGPVARAAGVPCLVHTVCGEVATAAAWQIEKFRDMAATLQPVLIAPSAETVSSLGDDFQAVVVPRGIDCRKYRPGSPALARRKVGLPPRPRVIGCASPAADLEMLFRALFRLEPDVHLALFGPALPGMVERGLIRRLGLDERVHVLGGWAAPELIHQAIDVYFHGPSLDCSPRPVLAAQACGKPVVAASPAEAVSLCPETGTLLPAAFQPALVGALRRALANTPAPAARKFAESAWSASVSIEGYETALRDAVRDAPDWPKRAETAAARRAG